MSDVNESAPPGGLSFERAEFEQQQQPTLACGYCKKPLTVQYWQIAKRPACADCHGIVERELVASKSPKRFLGAVQWGALAAVAGCLGWIVVEKITAAMSNDGTASEIGFVAIGVGYLVGKAVRKGAAGQGGSRYQALAVFLTYSAIAFARLFGSVSPGSLNLANIPSLVGFAYVLPLLNGARNIIGLFIIGIGLYEAWKLTRALPLTVLGPFPIETSSPAELAAPPDPDATH